MKKLNASVIATILEPKNSLKMIAIGRKAGLPIFEQLIENEQNPTKKILLQTALDIEHEIIKAAKREDQEQVDAYIIASGDVFKRIKEIQQC